MVEKMGIYFLNNGHEEIITEFLDDMQGMISDYTLYEEDFDSYKSIILGTVEYHNSSYDSVQIKVLSETSWILSLPNNLYWATLGFLSTTRCKSDIKKSKFDDEMLTLIIDTITNLESVLLMVAHHDDDNKMYLN
tara:strand:- start:1643 stop:2047 length:405 start_codon:yes stop_codon:yes gene_type:complete